MILSKGNKILLNAEQITSGMIPEGKLKEILLVVPTNRKLRSLKKKIIAGYKGKGVTGFNLETFESLCGKVLDAVKVYTNLGEASSSVLLNQAVDETKLTYFSSYKGEIPKGTLNRIKNVISEYKRHGIKPAFLREEGESLPLSEKLKAGDIAGIFEKYQAKTSALNAFESGDVYSALLSLPAGEFENYFNSVFPGAVDILLEGFDQFSELELDILDLLSGLSGHKLFLRFDYSADNHELFSHLDKTYKKLEDRGFLKIEDKKNVTNSGFNDIIKENLFSDAVKKTNTKFKDSIIKITSFNREDEVINIAKEIKRLIINEGIEPHKICVAFNLVHNYSPVFNEVFPVYGIPLNLTDRVYLEYTSPIITLLNLLEILENDYYYKNVIRAFSSNIITKEGIDLKSIVASAVELKIIGGKENWISLLKSAVEDRKRFKEENDSDDDRKKFEAALDSINCIRKILRPFEDKMTISEFRKKFELFVYDLNMPRLILELSADKEKELKALTTFLETLDEVFSLLTVQSGEEKKYSISFFLDQLRTSASYARFNIKEKSDCAVLVTSIEEIRGLEFDYLFIGGLCDGDLPTRYQPEIFLSKSFRKQEEIHLTEERYRFYQALCTWNKKLYLSLPMNDSGSELNESSFLKEFTRLFEITLLNSEYFQFKAYSSEEILKIFGSADADTKNEILLPELMKENFNKEHFELALNVHDIRTNKNDVESEYKGSVKSGLNLLESKFAEQIENQFGIIGSKQYSITQLETYAKCPFRFFVERVLCVKEEEEPTEEIEALEMGNLLHLIFFEFFTFLRNEKIRLYKCTGDQFNHARKKLFEIAAREIENMPFSSPISFYEKEKILGINGEQVNSILYKLLVYEKDNFDGYDPKFFETPFGNVDKEKSESSLKGGGSITMNGVKIKGKIDRIEINGTEKYLRVVDYKLSGKKPTKDDLLTGISLQLPVYLAAAEQIMFDNYNERLIPAEMVIYSLKYAAGELKKDPVKLASKKEEDPLILTGELIQTTKQFIAGYVKSITEGDFPLSKRVDREKIVCQYCGLKSICRVSEVKA